MTLEVRVHGRGGQGVVTAAELLALAAFHQGLHAQAMPSFGSERTGAPVVSFCRIATEPIRAHDPVVAPDVVVVQDVTLVRDPTLLDGLADDGLVVVNSSRTPDELRALGVRVSERQRVVAVPATALAREHLGRPMPNTALVGAVVALVDLIDAPALRTAVEQRFAGSPGSVVAANLRLVAEAAELVRSRERDRA